MKIALIVCGCILAALLLFFLACLFLAKPNKHRKGVEAYTKVRYAHRGLHNGERAENSLSAFRAAAEAGYGIELDVRLCKDGELVVFHDPDLKRVAGVEGKVRDKTVAELAALSLNGTGEGVPTFRSVLDAVDGKVPLLVEIKEEPGEYDVTNKTIEMLSAYRGDFIIESFNPLALGVVKKKMPNVYRGILSSQFLREKSYRKPMYFLLQNLWLNFICRPDFIAFDHRGWKSLSLRFARRFCKASTFAWTIRSEAEEEDAYGHGFDAVIFENYDPKKPI